MREKLRAAGIHLLVGLVLISLVFCLVYFVWYPAPFYAYSGGKNLMELIFGVDLILGPLLTFIAFNKKKPLRVNLKDIAVIACVQLVALGYGVHSAFQARPAFIAFEMTRFRVIHANEPDQEGLDKSGTQLPLWGPKLMGPLKPVDKAPLFDSTFKRLGVVTDAIQPNTWLPYEQVKPAVLARSKPVQQLKERFPERSAEVATFLQKNQLTLANAVYLPIIVNDALGSLVFDKANLDKPYYLDIDSF